MLPSIVQLTVRVESRQVPVPMAAPRSRKQPVFAANEFVRASPPRGGARLTLRCGDSRRVCLQDAWHSALSPQGWVYYYNECVRARARARGRRPPQCAHHNQSRRNRCAQRRPRYVGLAARVRRRTRAVRAGAGRRRARGDGRYVDMHSRVRAYAYPNARARVNMHIRMRAYAYPNAQAAAAAASCAWSTTPCLRPRSQTSTRRGG